MPTTSAATLHLAPTANDETPTDGKRRPHWNDLFTPVIRAYATARLAELADEYADEDADKDLDLRSWAISEAADAMRDLYDLYMERGRVA
ncbi:hypothetical protein [Ancylobacter moscoviensis]